MEEDLLTYKSSRGKTLCGYCDRDMSDDDSHGGCPYCCPEHYLELVEYTPPKSILDSSDDITFKCEYCSAIWYGSYNPE